MQIAVMTSGSCRTGISRPPEHGLDVGLYVVHRSARAKAFRESKAFLSHPYQQPFDRDTNCNNKFTAALLPSDHDIITTMLGRRSSLH
jgi:hypothetical protein